MYLHRRATFFLAASLLLFAFTANEFTAARFLSSDGILSPGTLWIFRFSSVAALLLALLLLLFPKLPSHLLTFLFKRHPSFGAACIGIATFLAIFAAAEAFAMLALRQAAKQMPSLERDIPAGLYTPHPILGARPGPGSHRESLMLNEKPSFDVTYTIGHDSFRVVPRASDGNRTILFLGDSFTFGTGVQDNETLPAQVAAALPQSHVINAAAPAWGPHQALALLESGELDPALSSKGVTIIYGFIEHHIRRAAGDFELLAGPFKYGPCYIATDTGNPLRIGSFADAQPIRCAIASLWWKSHLIQYLKLNVPPSIRDRDIEFTIQMFNRIKALAIEKSPQASFAVLFFPPLTTDEVPREHLIFRLKSTGLNVIDANGWTDLTNPQNQIPGDGHPTPDAHSKMATHLAHRLAEAKP